MTNTKTIARVPSTVALDALRFTGKAGDARKLAFMAIAPNSFSEDASRSRSISNLRVALGTKPNALQLVAAKTQWVVGRVASRLPVAELPTGCVEAIARLDFAERIILNYAKPTKDGTKEYALRKGQTGRRSPMQHRVIRNAEEAWSAVAAELAIGGAKTQKERNDAKKTRAPQMVGSAKGTAPTHAELVKPAAPLTANDACAFLLAQSSTLLMYSNKNAKLLPTDFGAAVKAFRNAIVKADKARPATAIVKA